MLHLTLDSGQHGGTHLFFVLGASWPSKKHQKACNDNCAKRMVDFTSRLEPKVGGLILPYISQMVTICRKRCFGCHFAPFW